MEKSFKILCSMFIGNVVVAVVVTLYTLAAAAMYKDDMKQTGVMTEVTTETTADSMYYTDTVIGNTLWWTCILPAMSSGMN